MKRLKTKTYSPPSVNKILGVRKTLEIPECLNLEELDMIDPMSSTDIFKQERTPRLIRLKLVVDLLYRNMEKDPSSENFLYSSVHSDILKRNVSHYSEYIRYLIRNKVIFSDNSYRAKFYSKRYCFNSECVSCSNIKKVDVSDGELQLISKRKFKNLITSEYIVENYHLFRGFYNGLYLDEVRANEKLKLLCVDGSGKLNKGLYKRLDSQVKNFMRGDCVFTISEQVARFYNKVTNLKSDLRSLISYQGESLTSLDIKNSQPYLMNIILDRRVLIKVLKDIGEGRMKRGEGIELTIMSAQAIPHLLADIFIPPSELEEFLQLTSSGEIYESVHQFCVDQWGESYPFNVKVPVTEDDIIIQKPLDSVYPLTGFADSIARGRKCSKDMFVRYLGGKAKGSHIEQYFENRFPAIHSAIVKIKEDDSSMFSRVLQYIEARLVLEVITKEFCHENPEAVVFTIHDSIATQERFVGVLRDKVNEVFTRYLPSPPQLHIEPWCEECEPIQLAA